MDSIKDQINIINETKHNIHSIKHTESIRQFQNLITQFMKLKIFKIDMNILSKICKQHYIRATNLYGYWQIASSRESRITREFLEKCIEQNNHDRAYYALCIYLQNPYNISRYLFYLLISNFEKLFIKT